jgi:hypothetical protein
MYTVYWEYVEKVKRLFSREEIQLLLKDLKQTP